MAKRFGWPALAGIFRNEPPKSPWGSGGGGNDDGNGGGGSGPRNPWSVPPEGKRGSGSRGNVSSIEDLLKRARRGGGGGGFNGGGAVPGLPAGPLVWYLAAAAVILIWLGFTAFHPISPQERGVVSTLGRYSGTLEPGYRFTLPAPFTQVTVVDVRNIRTENFPESGENLMITGDQNIVDLAYSVRWDISNAPDFVFQFKEPQKTVRATAETAMRAVVATTTLNDTIGNGRARIEARVQAMMQQILDEYHSGVRIQGVAIKNASAPSAVDEEFKLVSAAQQQAQGAKNNANAYAQQVIAQAQGEATEFEKIYEQYKLAPEVTRRRLYYETMEQVLSKTDKTIVETPGTNTYLPLPALSPRRQEPDPVPRTQPQPQPQPRQGGGR
ncbi:protease modulator HflK [Sphingomonas sp. G-3-2-10]|uniref:protease modulator HflK n=1 Tax=Sphingomonas sp. G-3-2-10 TaxID=2728838 RepID=UPI001469B269|nr:protease modulator HflK [Sphingomonas sp. G-3-2-10]NML06965.1 protease modulator HflK [Sphingomonas sp. G-3-2-10]